jgi:hypothetical protein
MTGRERPDATDLAARRQALEMALQSQAVRADGARLAALLADEFIEFGSSGTLWTRAATLADLPAEDFCPRGISDLLANDFSPGHAHSRLSHLPHTLSPTPSSGA